MVFGRFRYDATNQRLYKGAAEIQLTPKAAAVLSYLTKRPNQLVTHDELLDEVWSGVHVQPEVLKVYIAELRRALKDTASKPQYIETVHGRGYRFLRSEAKANVNSAHSARPIGRDRELMSLFKHLRLAERGQRQLVFITGEPGIGKTAVLDWFFRRIGSRPDVLAMRGQCAAINTKAEPFYPLLDALSGVWKGAHREKLLPQFQRNAPTWLIQFPDLSDVGDIRRLRDDLMGVTSQRIIREFGQAVESFAREELMVLGLDDIHLADSSTLDLLAHIGNRTESASLLVIATAEEGPDWDKVRALTAPLYVRHLCEQIRLEVLSEAEVKRIIDAKYPASNVGGLLGTPLHKISNGVPLFLSSAIEYMEAQKWILKTGNGWLASIPAVRIEELMPPALTDLVDTQLAALPPEHRQILEAASIIGLEFTSRFVGYALGQSSRGVEEQCTGILSDSRWLETAGFATTPDGEVSPQFRFRRKLYKEVLYARQTPSQRVERHRRIADALEEAMVDRVQESASELAFHFAAGKNCSKSLKYLRLAAANATRRYAGVEAAALLTEALKFTAHLSRANRIRTELEILNDLGAAYLVSGDFENCARVWHQVAIKAMKQGRTDIAVNALSLLAFPVGWDNPARLRSCADKVMAQIDKVDDPATRAEVRLRTLSLRDVSGTWSIDHAAMASDALRQMSGIDDPVRLACARIIHSWLQLRHAEYGAVISEVEDALRVVLQHRSVEVIRAELILGWALLHAGEWGRMYSVVTSAAAHANKQGNSRIEALFKTQLAWLSVECSEYDHARELCSAAQYSKQTERGLGSAMRHVIAGMAAIGLMDPNDALAHVSIARRSVPSGERFWQVLAQMNEVNAYLLRANPSKAYRASKRLLALASNMPEKTWKARALSICAKAAALNGQEEKAREHLSSAIHIVDSVDLPLAAWHVEAAAAEIFSSYGLREEAAQFAHRSRNSRERLFNSLASKDASSRQADKIALLSV